MANESATRWQMSGGVVREATVTPIENRPVFHYRPGTRVLSFGGMTAPNLSPEHAVELALDRRCQGIAWTCSESSVSPMYTLEAGRLARDAGLYTVLVTNGLVSPEALELLGAVLDVYRVDLQSLDRAFYRRIARTHQIDDVLTVARRAQRHFAIHVEAVTDLTPGLNDSDGHLTCLAERIVTELGPLTPWHLTSHVSRARVTAAPPAPVATLTRARAIGLTHGLRFVYTDLPGDADTHCPDCGALAVERRGPTVRVGAVRPDGRCAVCDAPLGIVP